MPSVVRITRVVRFSAAHRYHTDALSPEENRAVFGACNREHGHGHNYVVEVSIDGAVDPLTGMVMNLADLDRILHQRVVGVLDHGFLNYDVPEFATTVPTCENIALWIVDAVRGDLAALDLELSKVRVRESEDLWAEWERS